MATLPSSTTLLNRASGKSLTTVATNGIGAWLLAISTAAIAGLESILSLLLLPVNIAIEVAWSSARAFVLKPLGLVTVGAETSQTGIRSFGFLGLPMSVIVLLITFAIVGWYLRRQFTSDFLPGTFTDFLGSLVGVNEEGDDEN